MKRSVIVAVRHSNVGATTADVSTRRKIVAGLHIADAGGPQWV